MRTVHVMPVLALALAYAAPAAAAPWCILDARGNSNCGFQTFEQCLASQAGGGGSCQRNPDEPAGSGQTDRGSVAQEPSQPAAAAGTWCLHDSRGNTNCGFQTFQQCIANQPGGGGSCQRNPD